MKEIPHWDVDEDYIVDISNSITIFQRIQATDKELVLASAAPDLLEALQGFVDLFPDVIDGDAIMPALDKAYAAIAKAIGEEE